MGNRLGCSVVFLIYNYDSRELLELGNPHIAAVQSSRENEDILGYSVA